MAHSAISSILVIEDDETQLRHLAWLLRRSGVATVTEAKGIEEGLRQLDTQGTEIDLVICDLCLRDGDGMDVARQLAHRALPCSLAYASLYDSRMIASAEMMARSIKVNILPALAKPFSAGGVQAWFDVAANMLRQSRNELTRLADQSQAPTFDAGRAFRDREICAFFQPQVDVKKGLLHGFEALARWTPHPGHIAWPAYMFINSVLAGNSEAQLLGTVFRDAADLCAASSRTFRVSINVTARFLCGKDAARFLLRQCDEQQLSAQRVVIEITETDSVDAESEPDLIAAASRLRLCGFDLSVDDFGAGFSSIERISVLPVTELKMNRSLLRRAALYPHGRTVLEASIGLAQRLGVRSVVEGIETRADLDIARALGADCAQGRLFSMPISLKRARLWAAAAPP